MLEGVSLLNSVIGLTFVYVASVLPFTVWTLRGFVDGVPRELEEAAMMDGCSRVQAFFKVTLPLLAPGLVATGLFGFIQAWNEFTLALVVMTDPAKETLPVWLVGFSESRSRGVDWGAIMAASTLITIPVIVFFLIVQRRMVSGLTAGAVKG
jgi:N,N'-diacetylchitobiose transport system permease protein